MAAILTLDRKELIDELVELGVSENTASYFVTGTFSSTVEKVLPLIEKFKSLCDEADGSVVRRIFCLISSKVDKERFGGLKQAGFNNEEANTLMSNTPAEVMREILITNFEDKITAEDDYEPVLPETVIGIPDGIASELASLGDLGVDLVNRTYEFLLSDASLEKIERCAKLLKIPDDKKRFGAFIKMGFPKEALSQAVLSKGPTFAKLLWDYVNEQDAAEQQPVEEKQEVPPVVSSTSPVDDKSETDGAVTSAYEFISKTLSTAQLKQLALRILSEI